MFGLKVSFSSGPQLAKSLDHESSAPLASGVLFRQKTSNALARVFTATSKPAVANSSQEIRERSTACGPNLKWLGSLLKLCSRADECNQDSSRKSSTKPATATGMTMNLSTNTTSTSCHRYKVPSKSQRQEYSRMIPQNKSPECVAELGLARYVRTHKRPVLTSPRDEC